MARTKRKEPGVVRTYKAGLNYTCPVRGPITQIVDVKVYEYSGTPEHEENGLQELSELLETFEESDNDI